MLLDSFYEDTCELIQLYKSFVSTGEENTSQINLGIDLCQMYFLI